MPPVFVSNAGATLSPKQTEVSFEIEICQSGMVTKGLVQQVPPSDKS